MSKVSVIVPVYNVEQYIKRCLKSILDQSWQDFEILCVDDCGQDQSISIIEQMQKEYPQKIKILYGTKHGPGCCKRSRNEGGIRGIHCLY